MKALVLAAGYGTRLYPLTKDKPKPLLPINGKPILGYLLERVQVAFGLTEIYIVTNDKFFENFQQWATEQKNFSAPLKVVSDGTKSPEDRLGSIGDIQFILEKCHVDEDIVVLGGDNIFDYTLEEFFTFAQSKTKNVTVGLYDIQDKSRAQKFGVAAVDEKRNITLFEEKPQKPKSSLIAMCLYYLPAKTLGLIREYTEAGGKLDRAGDYIAWLCEKQKLSGFQFQGKWHDIGSIEAYDAAQKDF